MTTFLWRPGRYTRASAHRERLDQVLAAERQQAAPDECDVGRRVIGEHLAHRIAEHHADIGGNIAVAAAARNRFMREAIEEVERDCPDVLVLDVSMPDMDGWAVLDHLRREGAPRPRVAVLTAHADESVEILARNAGADAYLAKPLGASELTAAVRRLLSPADAPGPTIVDDPDFTVALARLLSSPTEASGD